MTQQGTIKKILPGGMAEIEVTRRSACGHDCAKCGGCGGLETQTLYVTARNRAEAQVGERVLIEGETGQVLGYAGLCICCRWCCFSSVTARAAHCKRARVCPRCVVVCCLPQASWRRSFSAVR